MFGPCFHKSEAMNLDAEMPRVAKSAGLSRDLMYRHWDFSVRWVIKVDAIFHVDVLKVFSEDPPEYNF